MGEAQSVARRFGLTDPGLNGAQFTIAIQHIIDCSPVYGGGFLGDMRDFQTRRQGQLPGIGCSVPRMSSKKLDFPAPFAPVMPIRSPLFRVKEASSKRTRVPGAA